MFLLEVLIPYINGTITHNNSKSLIFSRYCRENNYPVNLITDDAFQLFRKVLETRRFELKEMGLGNHPNAAVPMDDEDVELCWQTGAFGPATPRSLQNTLYFFFSNAFGWRTRDEQEDTNWGDIKLLDEGTPNEHLKWNERTTKTRKGKGPPRKFCPNMWIIDDEERCCVRLWKMLRDCRTEEQKGYLYPFFLTPKYHATWQMSVPFKIGKMSAGAIGHIMVEIKIEAGITKAIKGHSGRKTCATNLLQQGIPPTRVIQITGHASTDSLNNYAIASDPQQREMSDILVGGKRPMAPGGMAVGYKKRKVPAAAAAGSAAALVDVDPVMDDDVHSVMDAVEDIVDDAIMAPQPVRIPVPRNDTVLAPRMPAGPLQGGMPHELAGMFSGATIQGSVHVHIHYGNVSAMSNSRTEVTLSQESNKEVQ